MDAAVGQSPLVLSPVGPLGANTDSLDTGDIPTSPTALAIVIACNIAEPMEGHRGVMQSMSTTSTVKILQRAFVHSSICPKRNLRIWLDMPLASTLPHQCS